MDYTSLKTMDIVIPMARPCEPTMKIGLNPTEITP
jgi:hypothetical protein